MKKITFRKSMILVLGLVVLQQASASGFMETEGFDRVDTQLTILDSSNASIDLSSSDLKIGVSPDETVHITYYNNPKHKYEVTQSDDEFTLTQIPLPIVSSFWKAMDVTVLLPLQFRGILTAKTASGRINIDIDTIFADSIDLRSGSGEIEADQVSVQGDISLRASSGNITLQNINTADGTLTVDGSSGNKRLNTVSANSINVISSSGRIYAEEIICTDIHMKGSSGGVKFSELNAQTITIESSSRNVEGSIVGNNNDFSVTSSVGSGRNNLPEQWGQGDKTLKVTTNSGNIEITFTE